MTVKEMKKVLEKFDDDYEIEVNCGGEYIFGIDEDSVKWDDQHKVVEIVYDTYWGKMPVPNFEFKHLEESDFHSVYEYKGVMNIVVFWEESGYRYLIMMQKLL